MSGCIPEAQANLASMLYHAPAFALAGVVAWLTPISVDNVQYGEQPLIYALDVCRHTFPDLYHRAMAAIWAGASFSAVEGLICEAINRYLTYQGLYELDQMAWGIPYQPCGAGLWSSDGVEETNPDVIPILEWMGYESDDSGSISAVEEVALMLEKDLKVYAYNMDAQTVYIFLLWLFNSTGYDLADYTEEALSESDVHFDWTHDQIAFVNALHQEAYTVMDTVQAGRDLLLNNKAWGKAFRKNVARAHEHTIMRTVKNVKEGFRKRGKSDRNLKFTWPGCSNGSY